MVSKNDELEKTIERAFKKLGNDKHMIFLSLAFVHKRSGPSAIKTGKYNESLLIDDLEKYLSNKFNYNRNKSIK